MLETCHFIKENPKCFLVNFAKFSKTPFFTEHLRVTAHEVYLDYFSFALMSLHFAYVISQNCVLLFPA